MSVVQKIFSSDARILKNNLVPSSCNEGGNEVVPTTRSLPPGKLMRTKMGVPSDPLQETLPKTVPE